jgi:hypothetical protein
MDVPPRWPRGSRATLDRVARWLLRSKSSILLGFLFAKEKKPRTMPALLLD